jgi:signal transduction histidine kinase
LSHVLVIGAVSDEELERAVASLGLPDDVLVVRVARWEEARERLGGRAPNLLVVAEHPGEEGREWAAQTAERALAESRAAEVLELANGILHNVGNVVNSVSVSTNQILELLDKSRRGLVNKVAALLAEHAHDLPEFLSNHQKGRQIPDFLATLGARLDSEHAELLREAQFMRDNIDHVRATLSAQQHHAHLATRGDRTSLSKLVQVALEIQANPLERVGARVECTLTDLPELDVDRNKVLQILLNLIGNSADSLQGAARSPALLTLRAKAVGDRVRLWVSDNGIGIAPEHLDRIFEHGFTTKERGHGFGLHASAAAARAMAGSLTCHSDGPGQGATFVLEIPVPPEGTEPGASRRRGHGTSAQSWTFGPVTRDDS